MTADRNRSTWLFVAGQDRSGSTLVGGVLARELGGFDCGELHGLWVGLVEGRTCGCGVRLAACPLWSAVADEACAAAGLGDWEEAAAIMRDRLRRRHLLTPRLPAPRVAELRLRRATEAAVERLVGAPVVVDTSKLSSVLWTAAHIPRPLGVVHLVRDPRAVAFSQARPTPSPWRDGAPMRRRPPLLSASDWLRAQVTTERVVRHRDRVPAQPVAVRVRYEDLPGALDAAIGSIAGALHLDRRPAGDDEGTRHTIGGNTVRHGGRTVVRNERWRDEMPALARIATTALTAPLLGRYGYRVVG